MSNTLWYLSLTYSEFPPTLLLSQFPLKILYSEFPPSSTPSIRIPPHTPSLRIPSLFPWLSITSDLSSLRIPSHSHTLRISSCSSFFYFFKYKFIYFNWRLITLQYCIGFAIHQHESLFSIPFHSPFLRVYSLSFRIPL